MRNEDTSRSEKTNWHFTLTPGSVLNVQLYTAPQGPLHLTNCPPPPTLVPLPTSGYFDYKCFVRSRALTLCLMRTGVIHAASRQQTGLLDGEFDGGLGANCRGQSENKLTEL